MSDHKIRAKVTVHASALAGSEASAAWFTSHEAAHAYAATLSPGLSWVVEPLAELVRIIVREDLDYFPGQWLVGDDEPEQLAAIKEESRQLETGELGAYSVHIQRKCVACQEWHETGSLYGCVTYDSPTVTGQYSEPSELRGHLGDVAADLLAE